MENCFRDVPDYVLDWMRGSVENSFARGESKEMAWEKATSYYPDPSDRVMKIADDYIEDIYDN